MTRTNVPSNELIGVDACLHNDTFADVLKNSSKDRNAVKKALHDAGIVFKTQAELDDVITQIGNINWSQLDQLEKLLGRQDDGQVHPMMG